MKIESEYMPMVLGPALEFLEKGGGVSNARNVALRHARASIIHANKSQQIGTGLIIDFDSTCFSC